MKPKTLLPNEINADGFWSRVNKRGDQECWPWLNYMNVTGYGTYRDIHGKQVYAHRAAYILTHGSIPEGLTLDHLCRNKQCCNPKHLEPVSQSVNILRHFEVTKLEC